MLPVGLHVGVPEGVYRAEPGYNQSTLVDFLDARTPLHFKKLAKQNQEELSKKDFIRIGSAVDIKLTEPETWDSKVVVCPAEYPTKKGPKPWSRKSTFCAEWEEEHRNEGKITLTVGEVAQVDGTVAALLKHPDAGSIIAHCARQVVVIAIHPELGLRLKGRLDFLPGPEVGTIFDIKTGEDASLQGVTRQCMRLKRHVQARFYSDILHWAAPDQYPVRMGMTFVVGETEPPHGVGIHKMMPGSMEMILGLSEYHRALTALDRCITLDSWPCYPHDWQDIRYPRYAFSDQD